MAARQFGAYRCWICRESRTTPASARSPLTNRESPPPPIRSTVRFIPTAIRLQMRMEVRGSSDRTGGDHHRQFTGADGNTALRAPYIGYNPNSDFWEAEGILQLSRAAGQREEATEPRSDDQCLLHLVSHFGRRQRSLRRALFQRQRSAKSQERLRQRRFRSHPRLHCQLHVSDS